MLIDFNDPLLENKLFALEQVYNQVHMTGAERLRESSECVQLLWQPTARVSVQME